MPVDDEASERVEITFAKGPLRGPVIELVHFRGDPREGTPYDAQGPGDGSWVFDR